MNILFVGDIFGSVGLIAAGTHRGESSSSGKL
jgi:hypothetical protein